MVVNKFTVLIVVPVLLSLGANANARSDESDALILLSQGQLPPRAVCRLGTSSFVSGLEYPAFGLSPDGSHVAVGCSNPQGVGIWDLQSATLRHFLDTSANVSRTRVLFSHDGRRLFTCASRERIQVWNVSDESLSYELPVNVSIYTWWKQFAIGPDGEVLAALGGGDTIGLFDRNGNALRKISLPPRLELEQLTFSRSGNLNAVQGRRI